MIFTTQKSSCCKCLSIPLVCYMSILSTSVCTIFMGCMKAFCVMLFYRFCISVIKAELTTELHGDLFTRWQRDMLILIDGQGHNTSDRSQFSVRKNFSYCFLCRMHMQFFIDAFNVGTYGFNRDI